MTVQRLAGAGDDPLGPGSQDPDDVRAVACQLTAPDDVCEPGGTATGASGHDAGNVIGSLLQILVWVLFIGLVVVLVVLVARAFVQRGRLVRRARGEAAETGDDGVIDLPRTIVDHRRTPDEWRREADQHRLAGRHRDALRCRYRALVGDLARADVIDEIPGRTTGEEREQMSIASPDRSARFDAAADLFDGAWYGRVAVDERDVDEMMALEAQILRHGERVDVVRATV